MQKADADVVVSIPAIAAEIGVRPQTVHKIARRLAINKQRRNDPDRRNAPTDFVTENDAARIKAEYRGNGVAAIRVTRPDAPCFFYLVRPEPRVDPLRVKFGKAVNLDERLRTYRTTHHEVELVASWPCRDTWERAAIDCGSRGCERLGEELFVVDDLQAAVERCELFFELMPGA